MEILPEEITQQPEDNGSLLKKKKVKDPNQPKKVLTEGQKKALSAMNDARTKKAEEKLKLKYMKIMEKEQKAKPVVIPAASSLVGRQPAPQLEINTESSESSSEEVQVITKPTRVKTVKSKKTNKKKKKIIVMDASSSESESESEPEPEIIYQQRPMKSQQNRRSIIQQHNEKQITRNFFCN
jgi:hypothetical protein